MSTTANDGDDHEEVYLEEDDIIDEINVDEEDLPDADDDADSDADADAEAFDEADDSMHIFTGHTGNYYVIYIMFQIIIYRELDVTNFDFHLLVIGELYTVACSPTDAQMVATGGGDDKGFLWKIGQGDWALELQGHKDSVSCLAFSYDGQLVASGGFDGVIQVWDVSLGTLKCTLDGPGAGIEVKIEEN
ncbi:putative transcription factor WD40-like family [Helianthus annuus]|nr:putative transcription factor WD40-like family [Helianthus annuus]